MDNQLTTQQSTALQIPEAQLILARDINSIVAYVASSSAQGFEKAALYSTAISKISEMLTSDFMKPILLLQNKKMGFLTDAKEKGYNEATVKDCVIEAILTGLEVTGNQFNIIASKMYTTKEGFTALLDKVNGLAYDVTPNSPFKDGTTTYVPFHIKWKVGEGKVQEEKISFPVIVNDGLKIDAIIGKGERRAKSWLYKKVTGKSIGEGDVEADFVEIKGNVVSEEEIQRVREFKERQESEKKYQKRESPEVMMGSKEQEGADKFFLLSKSLEELESRKEKVLKSYPEINLGKYEQRKNELNQK